MILVHTVDEMKTIVWKNAKRRNEVLKSIICDEKLSSSISIVEYNCYMSESNENV
jgi:O-glycosyl hydrolase